MSSRVLSRTAMAPSQCVRVKRVARGMPWCNGLTRLLAVYAFTPACTRPPARVWDRVYARPCACTHACTCACMCEWRFEDGRLWCLQVGTGFTKQTMTGGYVDRQTESRLQTLLGKKIGGPKGREFREPVQKQIGRAARRERE